MKLGLISLLSTLVFVNIHYIRGNGIRIPLSIYELGLHKEGTMYYEDDQGLYGTISIGTPPQKINVSFTLNTLDNYITVPSKSHNTSNHDNSTTFRGEDGFDTRVRKYYHVEATDTITIDNFQGNKPWDGVVGLLPGCKFLKSCEKLGLKKKFSLYTNSPWDNNTSELMLCGEDETKFQGNLQYLNAAINYVGWAIEMQSVMLHHNHENVLTMKFQDTLLNFNIASSYIFGPANDVKKIYDKLNTRRSKIRNDLKEADCNNIDALPSITFGTADRNFTLTGNDYIKQMTQNGEWVCIVRLISESGSMKTWYIGSVFFRKFYTVFEDETPRRIGFAESVHPPAQIMVFLF